MEKQEDIKIYNSMSGDLTICQKDKEIKINLAHLTEEQIRDIINGIANILSSMSAYLYNRIKEED